MDRVDQDIIMARMMDGLDDVFSTLKQMDESNSACEATLPVMSCLLHYIKREVRPVRG